jgi:hypothetical protein
MIKFTPEELDHLADKAVEVARGGYGLPDRSQVSKLAEYSRSTPSIGELLLFIRYQGSRASGGQRDFFSATAKAVEEIRGQAEGDRERAIERVRRFMGLLVRATVVARESKEGGRQ